MLKDLCQVFFDRSLVHYTGSENVTPYTCTLKKIKKLISVCYIIYKRKYLNEVPTGFLRSHFGFQNPKEMNWLSANNVPSSDGLGSCKQKEFSQLFPTNMKYLLLANSWGSLKTSCIYIQITSHPHT